jgi:hypothetical protein
LRATRVVVDIGVHLGLSAPDEVGGGTWDADKAWQFLRAHTRVEENQLRFELDRYLGWPGQAPSYKVGERIWLQLRDEVRQREGDAFVAVPPAGARPLLCGTRHLREPAGRGRRSAAAGEQPGGRGARPERTIRGPSTSGGGALTCSYHPVGGVTCAVPATDRLASMKSSCGPRPRRTAAARDAAWRRHTVYQILQRPRRRSRRSARLVVARARPPRPTAPTRRSRAWPTPMPAEMAGWTVKARQTRTASLFPPG